MCFWKASQDFCGDDKKLESFRSWVTMMETLLCVTHMTHRIYLVYKPNRFQSLGLISFILNGSPSVDAVIPIVVLSIVLSIVLICVVHSGLIKTGPKTKPIQKFRLWFSESVGKPDCQKKKSWLSACTMENSSSISHLEIIHIHWFRIP